MAVRAGGPGLGRRGRGPGADLGWDAGAVLAAFGTRGHSAADVGALARKLALSLRSGDQVLIMSNGGFGGLHEKLLAELRANPG